MNNLAKQYDADYHAWAVQTIELLRQGKLDLLDIPHLIAELEEMGTSNKNELVSRLMVLLAHLLKWKFQPLHRSSSWRGSIIEQRKRISVRIKKTPSLKSYLPDALTEAYPDAVDMAIKETGLLVSVFPLSSPFSFEQALNDEFWPE